MQPHSRPTANRISHLARTTVKRGSAALCAALLLTLGACGKQDSDLPADAYVWQRIWTPPVTRAMSGNADVVRAWRVLMAEMNATTRRNGPRRSTGAI